MVMYSSVGDTAQSRHGHRQNNMQPEKRELISSKPAYKFPGKDQQS